MACNFQMKPRYGMDDLLEIMRLLRAPGGCPWDAEQTHESIRKNFIEETYEVIEAINQKNPAMLCEELGDVLMQVVFHTQMEQEAGTFAFDDVTDGVCKKLIERHPHVFGTASVNGSEEVLSNWEEIKRRSKGQETRTSSMQAVPRELPALMRGTKVQQKAAKAGFDWPDVGGAMDKLYEEADELGCAIEEGSREAIEEELGDLLFSAVNVSRFVHCDAEEALTAATDKFIRRFSLVEQLARERGLSMETASLPELDILWEEAKNIIHASK